MRVDIAKGVDKKQCDIKIMKIAVRFVITKQHLYTVYKIRTEQPRS